MVPPCSILLVSRVPLLLGTLNYAAVILIDLLYLKYHTPEAKCSSLQIILKSVNGWLSISDKCHITNVEVFIQPFLLTGVLRHTYFFGYSNHTDNVNEP